MSYKNRMQPLMRKIIRLERQNTTKRIDHPGQLTGTPGCPRPVLRRYIITYRQSQRSGYTRNTHIERRRIHGNYHCRSDRRKFAFHGPQKLHPIAYLAQGSKKHCGVMGWVGQQTATDRSHFIAPNAKETGLWNLLAQGAN